MAVRNVEVRFTDEPHLVLEGEMREYNPAFVSIRGNYRYEVSRAPVGAHQVTHLIPWHRIRYINMPGHEPSPAEHKAQP